MARLTTRYTIRSEKLRNPLTLAVVSDLHDGLYADVLPTLRQCDAILIVGDLVDRHASDCGYTHAVEFLRDAPQCAPTFYSIGNHERKLKARAAYWPIAEQSAVRILDNEYVRFGGIVLGALSSAPRDQISTTLIPAMAAEPGFRLLMCHHPEYYPRHVQDRGIDLTLSGHAHGGQVQLFGHGLYAPGQGLFPRLTDGFYDSRHLLVSRGMRNAARAPRLWNPCEMIVLRLEPGRDDGGQGRCP